jgi:ABC-type sugar transport system substrate-binding protein
LLRIDLSRHEWKKSMNKKTAESTGARSGIKAVAELAGVGIASVSRVLSGQPGSSPQMTQRVLEAARQLGYAPNLLAQSLRRRATHSIGFVGSDINNPLIASIVSGAESVLSVARYSVLLTNSGGIPSVDAERIEVLLQRQVDGLIVLPALEDDPATLAALRNTQAPVVLIDRTLPADIPAHYVLSDHYQGVGNAGRHLLSAGHRRIGLVVGRDVRPTRERIRAVEDAYDGFGTPRDAVGVTWGGGARRHAVERNAAERGDSGRQSVAGRGAARRAPAQAATGRGSVADLLRRRAAQPLPSAADRHRHARHWAPRQARGRGAAGAAGIAGQDRAGHPADVVRTAPELRPFPPGKIGDGEISGAARNSERAGGRNRAPAMRSTEC